jgi:hypothetical protein
VPLALSPLLARLDAAEDAGDLDARQLADLLGLTPGALRAALARPSALTAEQAEHAARALGVDRATMRALRRAEDAGADVRAGASSVAAPITPDSTLGVLAAALDAVWPDAHGRRLCAAVLDVAEEAARAAGRPLPPGAHALRRRYADSDAPDVPPAAEPASDLAPDPAGDPALVDAAAALVRELQQAAPGYDDLFAPLHDDALGDLLRRHGVAVHAATGVPAGTRAVLTASIAGRHRLVYSADATADQRRLVARAAAAHLVAGHLGEAGAGVALASPAPPALARLADTVALADLVPFWQVGDLRRRGRLGWRALAEHVGGPGRAPGG